MFGMCNCTFLQDICKDEESYCNVITKEMRFFVQIANWVALKLGKLLFSQLQHNSCSMGIILACFDGLQSVLYTLTYVCLFIYICKGSRHISAKVEKTLCTSFSRESQHAQREQFKLEPAANCCSIPEAGSAKKGKGAGRETEM